MCKKCNFIVHSKSSPDIVIKNLKKHAINKRHLPLPKNFLQALQEAEERGRNFFKTEEKESEAFSKNFQPFSLEELTFPLQMPKGSYIASCVACGIKISHGDDKMQVKTLYLKHLSGDHSVPNPDEKAVEESIRFE